MFKFINPKVEMLTQRIKDLELTNERSITEILYLKIEVNRVTEEREMLQDKLFTVVGLNKQHQEQKSAITQPHINVGKQGANWPRTRQTLEQQGTEKYWEKKLKEQEAEKQAALLANTENTDKLIKEIEGSIGVNTNAKTN